MPSRSGAGMVVNIRKDTSFGMEQKKVNGEVWLPAHIAAQGEARAFLLFSFSGAVDFRMSRLPQVQGDFDDPAGDEYGGTKPQPVPTVPIPQ